MYVFDQKIFQFDLALFYYKFKNLCELFCLFSILFFCSQCASEEYSIHSVSRTYIHVKLLSARTMNSQGSYFKNKNFNIFTVRKIKHFKREPFSR